MRPHRKRSNFLPPPCDEAKPESGAADANQEELVMSRRFGRKQLACAFSLAALVGGAQAQEKEDSGHAVFFDNDLLALDSLTRVNDDRNYTMGFAMAFGGKRFARQWLGGARAAIDDLLGQHDANSTATYHSVMLGVTAFTPNDLEERAPIFTDRPYGSLVFLGNQKLSVSGANGDRASRSMLVLGALGLHIAKGTQRFLHNQLGVSKQDPLGWHNQISNGGEITMLYSGEWLRRLTEPRQLYDLAGNVGYKVGYYTGLTAGLDLRLGRVMSEFYEHSPNPMANANLVMRAAPKNDLYAFASYQAMLVGYNTLLQGQVRDSRHTFSGSQLERLVHWAALGFVYDTRWGKLTYSFNRRSTEFKGPDARAHYWGGIYFTCETN
jgi:Uncharacterized protein conserved in bacteria (DUF2219)